MVEIRNRWTDEAICTGETIRDAVLGNLNRLRGAYLGGADLRGAYLRGADLRWADLRWAYLGWADLRWAYLGGADLRGADLRGACLRGADLRGACLRGADLNWQSHDLLAEILRQAAGDETEKLKVAGLVLVCRWKCWDWFASMSSDPLYDWAMGALAGYVRDGDGCPGVLRKPIKAGV